MERVLTVLSTRLTPRILPALRLLLCLAFLVGAGRRTLAVPAGSAVRGVQGIAYSVAFPQPWTHLVTVTVRVRQSAGSKPEAVTDLALPVWTPGSYIIRDFSRNVQDMEATDENGQPIAWQKMDASTWRIVSGKRTAFRVRYRVYLDDNAVQAGDVNAAHAFWNNTAVLVHIVGASKVPATLAIVAPDGWKVACGLPQDKTDPTRFRAADRDSLYDAPVAAGQLEEWDFVAAGRAHRLIIDGKGTFDPAQLIADLRRVAEAESLSLGSLNGGVPYTILLRLRAGGSGSGLEHRDGCALAWRGDGFSSHREYLQFLRLFAHEYFHQWNGKRLRPEGLGALDYSRENYSRLLWVTEGWTCYYEAAFLRRAGLMTTDEYLSCFAEELRLLEETPGRHAMSVTEASFDAWVKEYQPNANYGNAAVSYYNKGCLLALLLDLTIREQSGGTKSLDDVMRRLWEQRAKPFTETDVAAACAAALPNHPVSIADFFARFVQGREELPVDALLERLGLQLQRARPEAVPVAYWGAQFVGDTTRVAFVPEGSPAFLQGLSAGDRVELVEGGAVATLGDVQRRLQRKHPGDTLRLVVSRDGENRSLTIQMEGRVPAEYRLLPQENRTAEQTRLFDGWLGNRVRLVRRTSEPELP